MVQAFSKLDVAGMCSARVWLLEHDVKYAYSGIASGLNGTIPVALKPDVGVVYRGRLHPSF